MRLYFICVIFLMCFACKGKPSDTGIATAGKGKSPAEDTSVSASVPIPGPAWKFITRDSLRTPEYSIFAKSKYSVEGASPEKEDGSSFEGNCLIVVSLTTKKADTVELGTENAFGDQVHIKDVTGDLRMSQLMIEIVWPGDSDWYTSSFAGYKGDSLKELFTLENAGGEAVNLRRKDDWTLSGTVSERDELVYAVEDYPITVSLKDYKVEMIRPEKQYIGYQTVTTDAISGIRVSNKQAFTIKAGTEVRVDTLYRSLGMVRLAVADTVIIQVKVDDADGKIQKNNAG